MIQVTTSTVNGTPWYAYLSTEDNRIDTTVASTQIRHLIKFINDMDGSIDYAYAQTENIYNRYSYFKFTYEKPTDIYRGKTNLIPSGYYKYEVYEVSWTGTVTVTSGNAPATETDVLSPPAADKGIVQGLVTKGKLNLTDEAGTAQVQYTQREAPESTNYIYYGQ